MWQNRGRTKPVSVVVSFCVLLIAAVSAAAQDNVSEVSGHVVSSRGNEPLGLVEIQIPGTSFRSVTTDDGSFRFTGVPAGQHVLQASIVGYYTIHQEFALADGESKNFEIVLTPSNTRVSETVNVVADPFEVGTQTSASELTLQGEERKNLASVLADDPLRAVQNLPGVTSNNDFSSEFSLRGAPFSRVGLYLDGILLHAPFHTTDGQADNGSLTIFNGDLTEDMSLYEGAWPVRYADRTAGILAVDTRPGNREKTRGQVSASASNAGLLLEGPIGANKRGSWLADIRKSYLQYILNRIDFGDQAPMVFGFTDAQARLDYDLSNKHAVSLTYLDGSSSVDRQRFRDELGVNSVATSDFRFTLINLGSRYNPNQHLLISNHLAWSRETGDVTNRDNAALSNQNYYEWTWRGDGSVVWAKNTLDFGGEFRRFRQDGSATQFIYTPVLVPAFDRFRGAVRQYGAYVQSASTFAHGRGHVAVGVRQEEVSGGPVQITTPFASLSVQLSAKTRVQFDWGQYGQFPELSQRFSVFARGALLPERATHYETALEHRLDDRTRVRLEFYNRQDRDLLARPALDPRLIDNGIVVAASPTAPWLNSQRGYARGVQIFVQRRTANGFTGWISYAYERTMVRDGDLQVNFPSDYDQRHTLNIYGSRRLRPTVNLSGRFTYGSGMPLPGFYRTVPGGYALSQVRNSLRAPVYQRTDVRLNKAYVHQKYTMTLFGEIVNLTNHRNRDFDSPGPYDVITGRTFPTFFSMFPILPSVGMVLEF
jgi:CarboxypepD_reg-like domain/TonB-dependent Receptor Plug Domain